MAKRLRVNKYSREEFLLSKYNISTEQFDDLLRIQNNKCKICDANVTDRIRTNLSVDHCHTTGRIRGLLCGNCNKMLGHARENPVILLKGIQYLKGNL